MGNDWIIALIVVLGLAFLMGRNQKEGIENVRQMSFGLFIVVPAVIIAIALLVYFASSH